MINLEGVRISDLSEPLGKFPCNRLSIFAAGVSFAIGNFSYYCVVLSTLHIKMLFSSLRSVRIGKNCARCLGYRPRP